MRNTFLGLCVTWALGIAGCGGSDTSLLGTPDAEPDAADDADGAAVDADVQDGADDAVTDGPGPDSPGSDGSDAATDTGDVDPGDPTCTITAPPSGTTRAYDEEFTFVATASDPEDGDLRGASVVWRSDLVVPPLGSGLSIARRLPVPGVHTITCTATDSAGNTGSDSIEVTAQSPVARINHPGDGETRPAAAPVPFVGLGRDAEDGMLMDRSLVWTSDLDGALGTGTSFAANLSPGTNVVTLTVTDSDGNTGTDTVTLTITP